jgi:hypothetical protein
MPQTPKTRPSNTPKSPKSPKADSSSGSSKKKCPDRSRKNRLTEGQSSQKTPSSYAAQSTISSVITDGGSIYGGIGKFTTDSVYGGSPARDAPPRKRSSEKAAKIARKRGEKQAAEAARR